MNVRPACNLMVSGIVAAVATPPPVSGQALAGRMFVRALRNRGVPVRVIDLARPLDSGGFRSIGARALHCLGFLNELIRGRCDLGKGALFYLQLSPTPRGLVRDLFFLRAAASLRMRSVVHLHGTGLKSSLSALPEPLSRSVRRSLQGVRRAIVLSDTLRTDVEGLVPTERITVVANGVESSLLDHAVPLQERGVPVENSGLTVLFLSNLIKAKGYYVVLEMARLSQEKGLEHTFLFAGSPGEGCSELPDEYAARLGLRNIEWLGSVAGKRKSDLLCFADVMVLPSDAEGQPIALLEAMHFGLAVVASRVGGIPDMVVDGQNGFLVSPGDPSGTLECIERLARNRPLMQDMRLRAQWRARSMYTEEKHASALFRCLREVADDR